jgi:sulfur carrier protein ThiS
MKIRCLKLGESATEISMAEGGTVQQALDSLEWRLDGYSIMVNGTTAAGWTVLKEGDILTLVSKIEGGR